MSEPEYTATMASPIALSTRVHVFETGEGSLLQYFKRGAGPTVIVLPPA